MIKPGTESGFHAFGQETGQGLGVHVVGFQGGVSYIYIYMCIYIIIIIVIIIIYIVR